MVTHTRTNVCRLVISKPMGYLMTVNIHRDLDAALNFILKPVMYKKNAPSQM